MVEKMINLFEYVKRIPGHKNSSGELAPWAIVSHKTGKVLSSHKTKKEAEEHLRQMHIFKEGVMLKEDYTKFDKNTGTLWHTYGSKTKRKIDLFLKLAKKAGHKIEQHGGNITIITPNGEDYYTSTVELSKMTDTEIMDYVEDLLEPMEDDDLDESCRPEEYKMKSLNESIHGQSSLSAETLAQAMIVEVSEVKVDKSLYKKYEEDDIDYVENFLSSETEILEDFVDLMDWVKENMDPKAKALLMDGNSYGFTTTGLKGLSLFIIQFPGKSHPSITAYIKVSFNVLPYIQNVITKIINTSGF